MLEGYSYCPTLHTRLAEITALRNLPSGTKDRLYPVIVARPWPNARTLARTWERLTEALGSRPFALDLDRRWISKDPSSDVSVEFFELIESANGCRNYYNLIRETPFARPVLRLDGGNIVNIESQRGHVREIDRGALLRISHGAVQNAPELAREALFNFDDIAIIVDVGWSRDVLGLEMWASVIIGTIVDIRPETEIILSSSSFPSVFANGGARCVYAVDDRALYRNLVRRHNQAALIYGDWGSTRSPIEPTPMRNVPRIDLPTSDNWIAFRKDADVEDEEGYPEIAARTCADPQWPRDMRIWGTYTVEATRDGVPGGIRAAVTASAARINIHLHRQAYFGDVPVNDGDEPFTDE